MITFRSFIQRKYRPVVSVLGSLLRFRNVVLPLLFGAIMVCTDIPHVHAGPKDGNVVAGDANIVQLNPKLLEIIQASDKVIIDWRSFSIDWDELVRFLQPDSDSIALNRVNGDTPSYILGQLTADGRVMLINPNGVLFGDSAVVDIGSLVATTIDIRNEDFMAGDYNFDVDRASGGTVVNRGRITAAEGGIVALVAPGVENSGVIVARLGRVALASGNSFALDFYGDRLIQIGVDDSVAERLLAPDGTELKALVDNSGEIYADGGTVMLMAASVAKDVVDYAINMEGIIEARTATERNGQIVLEGAGEGIVRVTGTLDASGRESGDTGGEVKILGSKVGLVGQAEVDVSGDAGGGEVLIGGNFQGRGPERNADFTTIGSEVAIQADALTTGDGGRVIVWSDRVTRFYGNISARGGSVSGDGGFAEISGKQHLQFAPNSIDLTAPNGLIGELLLDPRDIFISDADGTNDSEVSVTDTSINFNEGGATTDYNITPAAFEAIDADITLQAQRNITVNSPIDRTGSGDSTLTLQAGGDLIINADITGSSGAHSFIFEADSPRSSTNNDGIGELKIASGVTITSNNGDITLIGAAFDIDTSSSIDAGTGDIHVAPSRAVAMMISTAASDLSNTNLSSAEIGTFTTSGTIYIGTATTGPDGSGGAGSSISASGITVSEVLTISGSASLVLDSGGTITLSADVSTDDGAITFTGAVILAGNVTVNSGATDGTITFTSTVDSASGGNRTLTVDAGSGTVALQGAVGGTTATTALASLTVIGGTIALSANVSTDDGAITFTGAVILVGNVTVNSGVTGGAITFTSTVDNGHALTVNAGSGTVELHGAVGGMAKLASLTVNGGQVDVDTVATTGNININGSTGIALNGVTYASDNGDITLGGAGGVMINGSLDSTVSLQAGGDLTINTDITGSNGAHSLIFEADSPGLSSNDGDGTLKIASGVTITSNNGDITLIGAGFEIDATSMTSIDAGTGEIHVAPSRAVAMTISAAADANLSDAEIGTFTTSGTIYIGTATIGPGGAGSSISASGITVGEDLTISGSASLVLDSGGATTLSADVSTDDGDITFADAVTLGANVTVKSDVASGATGGAITFESTVEGGQALTVNAGSGAVEFRGAVGGTTATTALVSLAVTGGEIALDAVATTGAIAIEGTDIDLNGASYRSDTGTITFTGPVDLQADVTVATAGAITFTSTVEGTQALTVNAGSGAVEFRGAVGGTTATTALVSLAVTGGQVNVDTVATTGNININGSMGIVLNGLTYASDEGDITFGGAGGVMISGSSNSTVSLQAGGNLTINTNITGRNGAHSLIFEADSPGLSSNDGTGTLKIASGVTITSNNGDITLIGAVFEIDATSSIDAGTGDIHVAPSRAVAMTISAAADNLSLAEIGTFTTSGRIYIGTATTGPDGSGGAGSSISATFITVGQALTIRGDASLVLDSSGATTLNADVLTYDGDITFEDAVTLAVNVMVDSDADEDDDEGNITFTSTVVSAAGGNRTLTVDADGGAVEFQGAVGATTKLVSLTVTGGEIDLDTVATTGAIAIEGTDIDLNGASYRSDAGAITFTGPVELHADVTVATAGDITFTSTVVSAAGGNRTLTVNAGSDAVEFRGAVGGTSATTKLVSLAVTGGEIDLDAVATIGAIAIEGTDIDLNGSSYQSDTGAITFTGAVDLQADVTVATAGDIKFTSTVDGAQALTVNAGSGTVELQGAVGANTKLSGLAVTGGEIKLSANVSTDNGAITFTGAVELVGDVTVDSDSAGGAITFTSTVVSAAGGNRTLTVNAGSGKVELEGAVGGTSATTKLVSLTVTGGEIDLDTVATTGNININGSTGIALNGATYASDTGAITFTGAVDLQADATVATAGDIKFTSTVVSAAGGNRTLTVNAGSGKVELEGAVGGTSATTKLVSLTVTGGEIALDAVATTGAIAIEGTGIALNGSSYQSDNGAITFTGPVDLQADVTVATAGNIKFTSTVDGAQALTVNAGSGTVELQGAVGANTKLSGLAVTGGEIALDAVATTGAIAIEGTDIDLNGSSYQSDTGAITFTGPVVLQADAMVATAGDIKFTSTVDGAQALTVNAGSGTVELQGAVGGTKLVSLTVDGGQIDLDTVATTGAIAIEGTGIALNGSSYQSDTGAITFTGAVDLQADVTVATAGNIKFTSTVDGAQALTVNAGSGKVELEGAVGANTKLSGLAVTGGEIDLDAVATTGAIAIEGTDIDLNGSSYQSDNGAITFTGAVDLQADVTVATAGDIKFTSTVVSAAGGNRTLTVNAGSGKVELEGAVGGTSATTKLVSLTVDGGQIDLDTVATTGAIAIEGTGIALNGSSYQSDTGAITFTGAVDLQADVTVATAGNIKFTSTVDGAQALTVNAGSGKVELEGAVGANTKLSGLAVTGGEIDLDAVATTGAIAIEGTDIDLNGSSYQSDTGAITFTGPVVLQADATVATAGDIKFTSTVDGAQALTVNAGSGTVELQGAVGGTKLVSLTVDGGQIDLDTVATTGAIAIEGTGIALNGSSYQSDTGAITFTGAVDLQADVTVATAGDIKFTSTVDGAQALTVNVGSGKVELEGAVGANTKLSGLAVTGGEIDLDAVATTGAIAIEGTDIDLNGSSYQSDNGAITFTGAVDLQADVTVATAGDIKFTSTVDGAQALTVNAGSGTVELQGAVGANTKLSGLAVTGGEIKLSANVSTDNGAITFTGAVELVGDVTVDSDSAGGAITFTSTVVSAAGGNRTLTVNAGSGKVELEGAVGGTSATTKLVSLTVTGGEIDLDTVATTGNININGSTGIALNGATYASDTGAITFTGAVDLQADVTVATAGDIKFTSTVVSAAGGNRTLTVNAGSGKVELEGAVGGTSATTKLVSLTVDGGQIDLDTVATIGAIAIEGTGIALNGSSYQSDNDAITFTGPVDLQADVTVATAGNIKFTSTVDGAQALTVNAGSGKVELEGAVGANTKLSGLAVTGGEIDLDAVATTGAIAIEGTDIDLNGSSYQSDTGAITFTGPVVLQADATVATAGDIKFTSTVDGAQALTVNAGSGTVELQGAVGGTKLVSLTVDGGQIDLDTVATTGAIAIEGTGIALNGSSYQSDTGAITFTGAVDLQADVTVATAGDIKFTSTVDGAQALTVNVGSGKVELEGAVGANTKLSGLAVTGGEIDLDAVATTGAIAIEGTDIDLNGSSYQSDNGAITFTGAVDLQADVTVATAGDIKFTSTVDGAQALTVNAGSGTVELQGAVGANTKLSGLAVTGGEIKLSANVSTDNGAITFTGAVELVGDVTVDSDSAGGAITFTSTVVSAAGGNRTLTVNAGSGKVELEGAVGGTSATTKLVSLTVTGGEIDLDTVATTGNININGSTGIALNGATYASDTGAITFTGAVDLQADVTVATAGDIKFTSTVVSAAGGNRTLTVNAGSGKVELEGAVGGTSATTKLVSLTVTGGQIDLDTVATTGNININGSTGIALNGATYASDTGDIILAGAGGVTISGSASLVLRAGGDITVNTSIERIGSADSTLALQAAGNLNINADITGRNGAHSLIFEADSPGLSSNDGNGTLKIASGVTITSNNGDITLIGAVFEIDATSSINAGTGDIHVAPSRAVAMTISTTANLSLAEIGRFTTSGTIYIGTATTGPTGTGGAGSSISAISITVSEDLTISGSASLVLDSSGATTLSAKVSTDDGNITFADAVTLSADVSTDDGNITFADAVTLGADVTVASDTDGDGTGGDITFTSTVDGGQTLTLNTATGNIYFGGDVGSADKLSAIAVGNAHDVTVATTMWVGSFTQTAGTGTTNLGLNTVNADTSVDITTMNIRGKIVVGQDARLTAQEDIISILEVGSLTIEASNAYLFGTVDGVGGRAASDLVVINNRGPGTYTMNGFIILGTGLGTRTYVELSSLPLAPVTPTVGVFTSLIPMLRASVNDSISGPYIVTDFEKPFPLLTPEHGAEDYYEDIPLLLKTHDDEMVEME